MFGWLEPHFGQRFSATAEQPVAGFSGATVVRLKSESRGFHAFSTSMAAGTSQEFCLRRWPPHSLPAARILGLHRLLRHIFDAGVTQVAIPLVSSNGLTLIEHEQTRWQLEPWLPGIANFHETPSEQKLKSAFTCLARWHQAVATFVPRESERPWFYSATNVIPAAVIERRKRMRQLIDGGLNQIENGIAASSATNPFVDIAPLLVSLFREKADSVANRLQHAATQPVKIQPCLRDVWHDHILFSNNEVTGIVDPTACRTENVASDISRLMGSMVEDDPALRNTALAAYETVRPLHPFERELVETLDASSVLLSPMTWLNRIFVTDQIPRETKRVLHRLQTFVRRATRLQ